MDDLCLRTGIKLNTLRSYANGITTPGPVNSQKIFDALGYEMQIVKKNDTCDVNRNASGCYDPVAGSAITKVDMEREKFMKLLDTIFTICEYANFHVEGRIRLRDKKTGKLWK